MKTVELSNQYKTYLPFETGNLIVLSRPDSSVITTVRVVAVGDGAVTVVKDDESACTLDDRVQCDLFRSDAVYRFSAEMFKDSEVDRFRLERFADTERIQRRENIRLDVEGSIVYKRLSDDTEETDDEWYFSDMLNVSASGMLMTCADNLHEQEFIAVNAELFRSLGVRQPILATTNRLSRHNNQAFCGLSFITRRDKEDRPDMPDTDQYAVIDERLANRIGHYIFTKQIEYRNSGRDI